MSIQCRGHVAACCRLLIATHFALVDASLLRAGGSRGLRLNQRLWKLEDNIGRSNDAPPTYAVALGGPLATPAPETSSGPSRPQVAAPAAPSLCKTANSCSRCTALPECGWCAVEQKCVDGTKLGPRTEQCLAYDFTRCSNLACEARSSCTDCLVDQRCGWCASTAKCSGGDSAGPYTASNCQATVGFSGKRSVWAHSFGVEKCQGPPPLHSSKLWSSLRDLMYRSQQRTARLSAASAPAAAAQSPMPVAPVPTLPPTSPPVYVMTTWIVPTTTKKTTTKKSTSTTTTTTPTVTTTILVTTMPPPTPAPKPPIKIKINIDQDVKNGARATQPESKTVHVAAPVEEKVEDNKGKEKVDKDKEEATDDEEAAENEEEEEESSFLLRK